MPYYYYRVPKLVKYVQEPVYDEAGEKTGYVDTEEIDAIYPDVPAGIAFVGAVVNESEYIIKTYKQLQLTEVLEADVPAAIINSTVREVK